MAYEKNAVTMRDETRFDRLGNPLRQKVVTFWLGNHGPFIETFDADTFTAGEFDARVQKLTTHLSLMGAK